MRIKAKKYAVRGLALLLAATMTGGAAAALGGEKAQAFNTPASLSAGFTDVTGEMDTTALRSGNFNGDVVTKNPYSADEERWAIVRLDGTSVIEQYLDEAGKGDFSSYASTSAAKRRAQTLEASHRAFLNTLTAKGIEYEYKYSYTTLLDGVAVKVRRGDVAAIRNIPGVANVTFSESYAAPAVAVDNDANVYTTGIYDSSDLKDTVQGEGMVVAILDTGLDFSHKAFRNMPTGDVKFTRDYIEEKFGEALALKAKNPSTTVDQIYYNEKVPFAFDYADDDPDVYPSYSSHGTHVAGIVAGRDDSMVLNEETGETFVGVAPEAQLAICKVFTDDPESEMLGGADTIDILAALSDCVTLGVDVINMSLGSSAGFSVETGDEDVQRVYDSIGEAGISLICAASNDYSSGYGGANGTNLATNPDSGTVGSPSTYSSALSVASINGQKSRYMQIGETEEVAFITNSSDANGNEQDFMEALFEKYKDTDRIKDGKLTLNYVVVGGLGKLSDYNSSVTRALAAGDTIALIKRGDITFQEKVQFAMSKGAVACIIYNNLSGTIRMSLGDLIDPVPTCSIGMDAGKILVDNAQNRVGQVTFSPDFLAGPFMSDFSSWGPTPDLKLKPEITAHGGEITSSIPGGYDEFSGTSMASPNMAGAVALLRQYVQKNYQKYGYGQPLSGPELNALVDQLLMSTATIAKNEEGNPYSPRKQGAGLAGIHAAVNTQGYITVEDEDGNVSDRTKFELGDDPSWTGEYNDMKFTVHNVGSTPATYSLRSYVMTETLASDGKTVAEKAYMLNDSIVRFTLENGSEVETVTVQPNSTVKVIASVKLGEAGMEYIRKSFKNGMYVEGFFSLVPTQPSETLVTLGVPFLAFCGDWTAAPLLDYDTYELAASQADPSVPAEDKLVASAAETRALGLYYERTYIIPLGSYLYNMSPYDSEIYPDTDKAAISIYDEPSSHTLYELYMVYAGLLRGAKTLDMTISDKTTGEIVFEKTQNNVGKSYAAGGANRGASVMLEINPLEWGLSNNTTYTFTMKGTLDYEGGHAAEPDRNSFTFDFTIDTEAPRLESYHVRFAPYTENRETKYRVYLDLEISDNQYIMDVMPCYIRSDRGSGLNTLSLFGDYPIPVYGQKGVKNTVSVEITDYYEEYVRTGQFYIAVEDYAMNQSLYQLSLESTLASTVYPDELTLGTDNKLTFMEKITDADGTYNVYDLVLAPNEHYKVNVNALPDQATAGSLEWNTDNMNVLVRDRELFGDHIGRTVVELASYVVDEELGMAMRRVMARINVTVAGAPAAEPVPERITVKPVFGSENSLVDINDTNMLTLNPGQRVQIRAELSPWYCPVVRYDYSSTNSDVMRVDMAGNLTAVAKGTAYLVIRVADEGYERVAEKRIRVDVGYRYSITNYTLYEWYESGDVVIPEDLNIMYLDEFCFRNNDTITSIVLPSTLTEISENAFEGCTNLKRVVIPSECMYVHNNAFHGCTSLETIELLPFVDEETGYEGDGTIAFGRYAFDGCIRLTTITHSKRITTAFDYAFRNCTSLRSLDISGLRVCGDGVFEGCVALENVTTGEFTSIGAHMFANCTALASIDIKSNRIGEGAFLNCSGLKTVTFGENVSLNFIGANAFSGCISLGKTASGASGEFSFPNGTIRVGQNAFIECTSIATIKLAPGTVLVCESAAPFSGCTNLAAFELTGESARYTATDGILYNKDSTCIELVPAAKTEIALAATVTKIGASAFANSRITELDVSNIREVGPYAFAGSAIGSLAFTKGLTSLGEGAFRNCTSLVSVTGLDGLDEVPAYAFQGCTKLDSVDFSSPARIGDYAFANSAIAEIPDATDLTSIGNYAFSGTAITEVDLGSASREISIGTRAFASNGSLASVTLKNVTAMGSYAFASCPVLATVTFGDGCTVIGNLAFVNETTSGSVRGIAPNTALTDVSGTGSVRIVGSYAFARTTGIGAIDLSGAEQIGDFAFTGSSASSVNLAAAKTIGTEAFYRCENLREANLPQAQIVGDYAFAESGITTVTIPKLERVGAYAFALTSITTVEIPATLTYTYADSWWEYDSADNLVEVVGKQTRSYGAGAFGQNANLTSITVETGSKYYYAEGGVLFAKVENGSELLQYPVGKAGAAYVVPVGTVRIGDSAFDCDGIDPSALRSVTIPYTVTAIGSYAFFGNAIEDYIFEGVEAPILEAAYDPTVYDQSSDFYYSNFNTYLILTDETAPVLHYPENGKGYDSLIWTLSFEERETTDYAADKTSHAAMDAIDAIPAEEIAAAQSLDRVKEIGELVKEARAKFNAVLEEDQIALLEPYEQRLLAAEQAIRDAKSKFGEPAQLTELVLAKSPDKLRYNAGEAFEPAGMVVKAIYDDMSEIVVTDYTIDKTVFSAGDTYVEIGYEGLTYKLYVNVSGSQGTDPTPGGTPSGPSEQGGKRGCGSSVAAVGACTFALAAALSCGIAFRKRKRK